MEKETAHTDKGSDGLTGESDVLDRLDCYKPYLLPDVQTYSMIVDAVTIQGVDGPVAALFAEQVLVRMHQEAKVNLLVLPNAITYRSAINAWKKNWTTGRTKKAEEIFHRMERLGFKHDTKTFSAVIDAWANSGNSVAANRAESILHRMLELYQAGK
jgi:hypothetical protein